MNYIIHTPSATRIKQEQIKTTQYEHRENIKDDLYNHCSDITMCSIVHVYYGLVNCCKAAYIKNRYEEGEVQTSLIKKGSIKVFLSSFYRYAIISITI